MHETNKSLRALPRLFFSLDREGKEVIIYLTGCLVFLNNQFTILVTHAEGENMDIGFKIKELRVAKGLTQEELADRAELSKGFISQLERDLTSPSISTLSDILQCLGVSVSDFFAGDSDDQVVFSEEDYFQKTDNDLDNKIEWIIPNAQKNMMEPIRLTLNPGGETYPDTPHEGEEFGFVIRGEITVHLGNKIHNVKAGESFYYNSEKKHHISSKKGAVIIWVSAPPSF